MSPRPILPLTCTAQGQALDYGNGQVIVHTDGVVPIDLDYDVLECWSYQTPAGTPDPPEGSPPADAPARVRCDAGNCKGCSGDCPPPPSPPNVPPATSSVMKLRVRRGGEIGPTTFSLGGLGPVQHVPYVPNAPFATILAMLTESVGEQNPPRVFHLYRAFDPGSGAHPFHNKIVAIPVPG